MTPEQYEQLVADYRAEFGQLIDKMMAELPASLESEVYADMFIGWEQPELDTFNDAPVVGWCLTIERYDPMNTKSNSYLRFITPPMQSPAHTLGLLDVATEWYRSD